MSAYSFLSILNHVLPNILSSRGKKSHLCILGKSLSL